VDGSLRNTQVPTMLQRWLATFAAVAAVCVATGALVARLPESSLLAPASTLTWIAAIGLGAVAWPTLRHRSVVGLALTYGFLGFGAIAALLCKPTATDFSRTSAQIGEIAQQTDGYRYLAVFVGAAFAIWAGSLIIGVLLPRRHERFVTSTVLHLSPWVLPLAALPLLANVYGIGLHTVLHAARYLEHTGPHVAVVFGKALGPIGVLICGYFTFHRRQPAAIRALALALALGYEMFYLATATRSFALWVPLMFVGGLLTGNWSASRQRAGLLIVAILAIFALQIPLGLRNLPNHGLIPAISYLVHQPSLVLGTHDPIHNFLFGAPLTLYVSHNVGSLPMTDVVTSLSPVPSAFNNWSQIAPSLRLNIFVPYSALGELLNHGWGFFLALMAMFGAGFALTERVALRRSGVVGGLSQIVVFGAAALFMIESTEYNLRSVVRLLYYAFIAVLVLTVLSARFQLRKRSRRGWGAGTG
jgi:hypothetical protein